jgi:anti-sigma B factor antagonist
MNPYRAPTLSRSTRASGLIVVAITGELDTAGTTAIEQAFHAALPDRTGHAVVDLSGVPFLTSRALALLVVRAQAMKKAGGKLSLAALTRVVLEVFERAGFAALFPIYPSVDAAVAALEGRDQTPGPSSAGNGLDFS